MHWHFWNISIFSGDFADFDEIEDIYNTVMATFCVMCAGTAAGLTVGLLSLDITKLEIKMMTGSSDEKKAAQRILPVVKQHHLLLVTLLLFNALANETLPVFLGALMPNYLAVIVSVTLVLVFGEIIPSAFFTGPQQLMTAAKFTPLVYGLFALFYPIAFPLSKILDYWFGEEDDNGNISRKELEALVILQGDEHKKLSRQQTFRSDGDEHSANPQEESLSTREVQLMTGILKLSKMAIHEAMIPIEKVCMISSATRLNDKSLSDILESGYSRIPVYHRNNKSHIVGYLLVKELIVVDPHVNMTVSNITLREPLCVKPDLGLMEMLGIFQQGQCHIALVSLDPVTTLNSLRTGIPPSERAVPIGLVTMEDVLEKIIQCDILDETDTANKLDIFPHGGAPMILYHKPKRAHSRLPSTAAPKESVRIANNKRKSKDRVPSRGSVVTSEYHQQMNDSDNERAIPSRRLYYQYSTEFDHTPEAGPVSTHRKRDSQGKHSFETAADSSHPSDDGEHTGDDHQHLLSKV